MKTIKILQNKKETKTITFYNVKESANIFNVSVPTIHRWIKAEKICSSRFGKAICIPEEEIMRIQKQCLDGIAMFENLGRKKMSDKRKIHKERLENKAILKGNQK